MKSSSEKYLISAILFLQLVIAAVFFTNANAANGQASEASGSASQSSKSCKIGFAIINQHDVFFAQLVKGAKETAEKIGCQLTAANANDRSERQSINVERLVARGIDGLIIDAPDPTSVVSAVDAARKQGIKVVSVDTDIGASHYDTFVGVNNGNAAAEFGKYMKNHGLDANTKYGIVDARNSVIQNIREDRFKKEIKNTGATLAQVVNGENKNERAANAAENLLRAQQDLDYIYTTGTPATLGATSALRGRSGNKTKVVGWDLSKRIIKGIDDGTVQAIVQQHPYKEGVAAAQEMKRLINGAKPKGKIIIPVSIVTKNNVDEFRDQYD